jgi:hypothetical protein
MEGEVRAIRLAIIGRGVLTTAVVAWVLTTGSTFAQTADTAASDRSRISASELLKGQDAAGSFENLGCFLVPGYEVVVTDTTGSSRRGRVISISQDHIVFASAVRAGRWEALRPFLLPMPFMWPVELLAYIHHPKDQAFAQESVNRIDIVDPVGNGIAIGGAVGVGVAAGVYLIERQAASGNMQGIWTLMATVIGIPVSLRVGHVVDRAINEPIYQRRPEGHSIAVTPQLGPRRVGVALEVRY